MLRLESHAETCPPLSSKSSGGLNAGCSSVVRAPDDVNIEVDMDVQCSNECNIYNILKIKKASLLSSLVV